MSEGPTIPFVLKLRPGTALARAEKAEAENARLRSALVALAGEGCWCAFGDDPRLRGHTPQCARARAALGETEPKP